MSAEAFMAWYETQPSGRRYELLDGVAYEMQAERAIHARVKARVHAAIDAQIRARGLLCEVFPDGMAVRVDDETVFEPDVLVRCGPPVPDDTILLFDPMIVVEVASPTTQRVDVLEKFSRYFRNPHIIHYLIVIPRSRVVIHHRRMIDDHIEAKSYEDGIIPLDPPGLALSVADLFPDEPTSA